MPAAVYDGFDYVALGHLHRPQRCGRDTVRYAGSLLKYSFAEHDHVKSVSVVEIGAPGSAAGDAGAAGRARVTVETVALTPRRDVRRLEGTLAELLEQRRLRSRAATTTCSRRCSTGARCSTPSAGCAACTPTPCPSSVRCTSTTGAAGARRPRPGRVGDLELFDAFFEYATGEALDEKQRAELAAVIDGLERRRREAPDVRPLAVTMQAFGPYAGEQSLDFADLRGAGFFLITGPTGAGKTTVLDAMSFALYGDHQRRPRERGRPQRRGDAQRPRAAGHAHPRALRLLARRRPLPRRAPPRTGASQTARRGHDHAPAGGHHVASASR